MKNSRGAAVRVLPYFLLAVALIAMSYPAFHPPLTHADDQTVPTIGSMAPDFTLDSQEGKPISLHDFKGKWVVLISTPRIRRRAAPSKRTLFSAIKRSTKQRTRWSWASAWTPWNPTKSGARRTA